MASPRPLLLCLAIAAQGAGCSVIFDPSDLMSGAGGGTVSASTSVASTGAVTVSSASTARSSGSGASPCAGEPCSGRGTCDDATGVAVCTCEFRFTGDRCEDCAVGYQGPACAACATGYQDKDDDGSCLVACTQGFCSGAGVCRDEAGAAACSCDPRFDGPTCATACPAGKAGAGCAYTIVLGIDLPETASWAVPGDLAYDVFEPDAVATFTRVGYRFVLDDEQVWVEMDAFTDEGARLGIPVDWQWQLDVDDVLVTSLAGAVATNGTPTSGNVEMWNECYDEGPDGAYDARDIHDADIDCYGSFQVHVDDRTVFAFNAWAGVHDHVDIGIGEAPAGHPDWTFAGNGADHAERRLEVYVK